MPLDPSPKPVLFQDVAVGERFHRNTRFWFEKIASSHHRANNQYNAIRQDGKMVYFYPLETVWRK